MAALKAGRATPTAAPNLILVSVMEVMVLAILMAAQVTDNATHMAVHQILGYMENVIPMVAPLRVNAIPTDVPLLIIIVELVRVILMDAQEMVSVTPTVARLITA